MTQSQTSLASQIDIFVDGSALSADIMADVLEVMVDQHTHLPAMFQIRIYDKELSLIDGTTFDLAKEVEIKGYNASGTAVSLIKGEITAIEPLLLEGMKSELIVYGYDKSHRLFRETKSQAFLNIKDSDLARQIASNAGLGTQIDSTPTVYEHLFQHNQTDMEFLTQRAWRIGYECFVQDNRLYFHKPVTSGSSIKLKWGEDLISFRARESAAEQVSEVQVKGWDPEKLQAIVGQAQKGNLYPSSKAGGQYSKAGSFGTGTQVIVNQPVISQAEANALAEARLNEISGAFIIAEGEAFQRPDIKAGKIVEIEAVGTKFSGKYMVTQARHAYDMESGFRTQFTVRGTRTGLLAEQVMHHSPMDRWPGVVMAIVTNTDDPQDWGRVKVKFPWLAEDAESWWARVMGPGGGPQAGFINVPEVGDEVLVTFEHGDFDRPVILGGLWNGKQKIPPQVAGVASGEKPLVRAWNSITGHVLAMYDNADNKVELITAGGHTAIFDDANKKVEIITAGGHKIILDDQGKKLDINSAGGHKVTLDDTGKSVKVESSGTLEVKAAMSMKLTASANMDIQASGPLNIKGAIVNIN